MVGASTCLPVVQPPLAAACASVASIAQAQSSTESSGALERCTTPAPFARAAHSTARSACAGLGLGAGLGVGVGLGGDPDPNPDPNPNLTLTLTSHSAHGEKSSGPSVPPPPLARACAIRSRVMS